MINRWSKKRPNRTQRQEVKVSDILSFTSAIIAIVATAIFYFAGWVYVSHWYSFWGIAVAELNLPPQVVLIHGVPGILFVILTALVTASIFAIWKFSQGKGLVTLADLPTTIMAAYFLSLFLLIVFYNWASNDVKDQIFTLELEISLLGYVISLFCIVLFNIFQIRLFPPSYSVRGLVECIAENPASLLVDLIISILVVIEVVVTLQLLNPDLRVLIWMRKQESWLQFLRQQFAIKSAVVQTSQFWVGAFLILYFLVSISVSSILGEWDARAGRMSMVGGWQLEQTYFYSPSDTLPLPLDYSKSTATLRAYGPLMLLGNNGNRSFLTDWVSRFPYKQRPNLYIIPNDGSNAPSVRLFAPTPTPTMTPLATKTPTAVSTVLAAPTP